MHLPPLKPWLVRALGILLMVWIAELILANFVLADSFAMYKSMGFWPALDLTLVYQPLTRLLLQGNNLWQVVLDLVVLYFFLPWVIDRFTRRQLLTASLFVVLGCAVAGIAWVGLTALASSAGLAASATWLEAPALGWHPFVIAMVALFGLALPDATINLFFVMPIKARWVFWITIAFSVLGFLAQPGVPSFDRFGAILGIVVWFFLVGPGATRRRFKRAGKRIERDVTFRVYQGGRQGGQRPPDDVFH